MSFRKLVRFSLAIALMIWGMGLPAALADTSGYSTTPQQQDLSLDDAVNMAWAYSPELKEALDSINMLSSIQKDAAQMFQGFQPGTGINESPATDMIWKGLVDAGTSYDTAENDYSAIKGKVQVDTLQDYYAVISAQAALDKAKADLERDGQALNAARVFSNLGMTTDTEVAAAESQDQASSDALAAAQQALDKTYITLDAKLGLMPDAHPVLTGQLTFSPLKIDSLDAEVSKALSSGSAIVTAPVTVNNTQVISDSTLSDLKNTVSLEQLEVDFPWTEGATGTETMVTPSGQVFSYEDTSQSGPDLDAARQTLTSATDSLKTQVRGMYKDIMSLEAQYSGLQGALQTARDNLQDVQVEYRLGLATPEQVTAADTACADLQSEITGVVFDHEVLAANFHWLTGEPVAE
jgi:hypothetical protein